MSEFFKGDLIKVDKSFGVVTHLETDAAIPEDHLGIWFGETEDGKHKIKTVPAEYCEKQNKSAFYH